MSKKLNPESKEKALKELSDINGLTAGSYFTYRDHIKAILHAAELHNLGVSWRDL